jgi:hypothetical protein
MLAAHHQRDRHSAARNRLAHAGLNGDRLSAVFAHSKNPPMAVRRRPAQHAQRLNRVSNFAGSFPPHTPPPPGELARYFVGRILKKEIQRGNAHIYQRIARARR